MTDPIGEARRILEARLGELEAEAANLRQAIATLDSTPGVAPSALAGTAQEAADRASRPTRKRARPGERERQLIASIESNPGAAVADHARALGVRPQQLYPLLHRLEAGGRITKSDDGYRLAPATAPQ